MNSLHQIVHKMYCWLPKTLMYLETNRESAQVADFWQKDQISCISSPIYGQFGAGNTTDLELSYI